MENNQFDLEDNDEDMFQLECFANLIQAMVSELAKRKGEVNLSLHVLLDSSSINNDTWQKGGIKTKIAIQGFCQSNNKEDQKLLTTELKRNISSSFNVDMDDNGNSKSNSPFFHLPED